MRSGSVAALTLVLAAACSCSSPADYGGNTGGGGAGGGGGVSASVTIQDFSFSPASVTLQVGGTVTWTNSGPSSHTVTSDAGSFEGGTLSPPSGSDPYGQPSGGGTYRMSFPSPGSYSYHCSIHPGMQGTITVR